MDKVDKKMKILHISPQQPSLKSGGGIGVLQTLLSLKSNSYNIDYVGPQIDNIAYIEYYDNYYYLLPNTNKISRLFNLSKGITLAFFFTEL